MSPCTSAKLPGGGGVILCGPRGRAAKCHFCGRRSSKLCDFVLVTTLPGLIPNAPATETCDKPLCEKCAVHVEPDTDYCPSHQEPATP